MYVKQEVRKGLLGRMLTELLDTRVMVKQAMKGVKDNKVLSSRPFLSVNPERSFSSGPPASPRRSATGPEVYSECDIRVYERNILGPYASSRDSRQHRPERARDTREGVFDCTTGRVPYAYSRTL